MLLDRHRSCLLVVDIQERLAPAMSDLERALRNAAALMQGAARLGVPMVVSEQYPKGLGPTVGEIRRLAPEGSIVEKIHFSCASEPAVRTRLAEIGRKQIVVCGMEAHVCVLQSALGLRQAGFEPAVVADATASRVPASRDLALARLRDDGVAIVTTEMVIFEWLDRAGTDEFREVSRLIK